MHTRSSQLLPGTDVLLSEGLAALHLHGQAPLTTGMDIGASITQGAKRVCANLLPEAGARYKNAEPQVTFVFLCCCIHRVFMECLLQRSMSSSIRLSWGYQFRLLLPASRLRLYRFLSSGLQFPFRACAPPVSAYYHNLFNEYPEKSSISQGSASLI